MDPENIFKGIEESYQEIREATAQDAKKKGYIRLFELLRQSHQQGKLYRALDTLESKKIEIREELFEESGLERLIKEHQEKHKEGKEDLWAAVINILYKKDLNLEVEEDMEKPFLDVKKDGQIIERTPQRLLTAWKSDCPVLKYGSDLPAGHVCRGAYHRVYEDILRKINKNLWFTRAYGYLRPKVPVCIELIQQSDLIAEPKWGESYSIYIEEVDRGFKVDPGIIGFNFWKKGREPESWENTIRIPTNTNLPVLEESYGKYSQGSTTWLNGGQVQGSPVWMRYIKEGDYSISVFDKIDKNINFSLPVFSLLSDPHSFPTRFHFMLWAENRDEWVDMPCYSDFRACGQIPRSIEQTGYGNSILEAFSIPRGVITPEEAIKTHPLRLGYIGQHHRHK